MPRMLAIDIGIIPSRASTPRYACVLAALMLWACRLPAAEPGKPAVGAAAAAVDLTEQHRSPVDLALSPDEAYLWTVNQTSHSVSLVRVTDGQILSEIVIGQRPQAIALARDGNRAWVTTNYGGELVAIERSGDELSVAGRVRLGHQPYGVVLSPDEQTAFVALSAGSAVAVIDLAALSLIDRIETPAWPRTLALTPDGARLAVGTSGGRSVSIIDAATRKLLFENRFAALNIGQMVTSRDGQHVYFPWAIYRSNPITTQNIKLGWVLGSRIGRVRFAEESWREAITLDVPEVAVADPHGLAITSDEKHLVASAAGTHEILVYRLPDLPFIGHGGPGDHIDPQLASNGYRFWRIPIGGRPLNLRLARDDRRVFVANYLLDAIQIVDIEARQVERTIPLGGPKVPTAVRHGEAAFYDGQRSLDQWYSCHTCHFEGGTNAIAMDTRNDDSFRTYKTVLPLYNVARTPPWTWHGWQRDLSAASEKSFTETMLGPRPTPEVNDAMVAYLTSLQPPPITRPTAREPAAQAALAAAQARGKDLFVGKAACANCHSGPYYTDGENHDVGTRKPGDAFPTYNTPSLIGVSNRVLFLHDGRSSSLFDLLRGPHDPAKVSGTEPLTEDEAKDLAEYLRTL